MLFSRSLKARLSMAVPVATVAGTFALAFAVYRSDDPHGGLSGFAQGVPEAIAALEPARIATVHVAVGAEVEAGQLIATLDTSAIDGAIAVARAEKVRLEADIRSERFGLSRKLEGDTESLERATTKEREDLHRASAEAHALEAEIARVGKLVADRQAIATDLASLKLRYAQVASIVTEKPRTLGVLARQLDAAVRRRGEVDAKGSVDAEKLEAELQVVDRRIELLEKRRADQSLRATRKGRVASVEKNAGETANAGEPIVKLVGTSSRVTVCVPERRSLGLREGEVARLWTRGQRGTPLMGRTVAVGPVVAELPARCWPVAKLPMWGREVTVAIDTPSDIVVGAAFDVALGGAPHPSPSSIEEGAPVAKRGGSGTDVANIGPASASAEPRLMTVPPALARRTRFEPSGVLARPDENRYLIVSDDTGQKDGADEGRPWLFSMDASGTVAPAPVAISGVPAIDDLESITVGDGGELYVLSSQSYSRKGRRNTARTALLRLRKDGEGLKVDGEAHLAELLDQAPERAATLGLARGTRELDIEGMTFHRGALYFGVKAPVDASGSAMIWKVTSPKALFDGGAKNLDAAGLTAWGHVRVDVTLDGTTLAGGISDLLFHGDTLFVTSTPSIADGAAGALWRVDHVERFASAHGAELDAKLVRRFVGRKPEGLSPSLKSGNLLIVFDAGSATPSFLDTPWP
jgi:multidrug efflux pump subunit AcrA (membrane-fusion protein)